MHRTAKKYLGAGWGVLVDIQYKYNNPDPVEALGCSIPLSTMLQGTFAASHFDSFFFRVVNIQSGALRYERRCDRYQKNDGIAAAAKKKATQYSYY